MSDGINGNQPRHLDKLHGMLGGMAKAAKSTKHRDPAKTMSFKPTKICPICRTEHEMKLVVTVTESGLKYCADCQQHLDEGGYAAFTIGGKYLLVPPVNSKGVALPLEAMGKIELVPDEMFDNFVKRFGGAQAVPEQN